MKKNTSPTIVLLVFAFLLSWCAHAELIREVRVKGNKRIERDAILVKLSSKSGENLSKEKIAADIRTLHATGYFNAVSFAMNDGALELTVEERPSVAEIKFQGNDAIDTDDLSEILTIKPYSLYDENLVRESVDKIAKLYEERGYYLAKVSYHVKYNDKDDSLSLGFKIREFERVKVKNVTFLGNRAFSDDELRGIFAKTSEDGFFSFLTSSGNFKELDFKNDMQRLQIWYLNEGYVRFRHEPPIVTVSEDKRFIFVTVRVHEGEKYNINTINFGGDLLFSDNELYEELELRNKDVFSILKRNRDVIRLSEKYQDLGYANVNVVPDMKIDDEARLVDIKYNFEKGPLVRFGKISVKGNSKTRDYVIRRELRIYEGELYSGTGMRRSRENVQRLGFFENETLIFNTSSPEGRPDIMDVEIEVKERPTGQFQLGAGYGTASGFFFTTQVAETNFRGKGQDLRLSGSFAANTSNRRLSLSFTDPYAWDTNWALGGSVRYDKTRFTNATRLRYIRKTQGFDIEAGHPVAEYTRAFLQYSFDKITLLSVDPDDLVNDDLDRENGIKSAVKGTILFDKRNNRADPTGGFYARFSEEYAGIGGNRDFLRTVFDVRWYQRIIDDLVFRTRFEAGNLIATSNEGIQVDERFYLGGPSDLRGYGLFTVGPRRQRVIRTTNRDTGVVTTALEDRNAGGRNRLLYNAELEYPLLKDVGLKFVLFYDAGDSFDGNDIQVHQNWGWGLRWFSPLGPLRFEWGYPINPREGFSKDSEFQFNIGPPF